MSRPSPLPSHDGQTLASVVIVNWNTKQLLRDCLESVDAAARALPGAVEVVVVDNASTDGSDSLVRDEFPRVRLIRNETNNGFAAANNQGLRECHGRFLLLLNPDTKVAPDAFAALVSFLDTNPRAGAVGPRIVGGQGELQVSCSPLPTLGRELWRLLHLDALRHVSMYPGGWWASDRPRAVDIILGACMLIRRDVIEQVGSLDERFFIYTEEVDLCRRILEAGWEIYWLPAAEIVHYGGASTSQVSSRMFLELYRSKVQYFRKHFGVWGALAYKGVLLAGALPRLVLMPAVAALVPSRRRRSLGVLRNYSSLLVQLPAL